MFKGIKSFQPNRQKRPWHWKGWAPLIYSQKNISLNHQ